MKSAMTSSLIEQSWKNGWLIGFNTNAGSRFGINSIRLDLNKLSEATNIKKLMEKDYEKFTENWELQKKV